MAIDRALEPEYEMPADEAPSATCSYCGQPFRSKRYMSFHVGLNHAEECSEAELSTFNDKRDDEKSELFIFQIKAAISVFLLYFLFTFFYTLVWSGLVA